MNDKNAADFMHRFFCPVQVRYVETDQQGHVFFGHYLTYFDLALTEYLKAVGYGYDQFLKAGIDFFYVEALCQYRERAFFDEMLHIHARIGKIGTTSFTFQFGVFESNSQRFIANGHIVAVAVDKKTKKPVPAPDALREAVARFEAV
jgi:acyl-CoA thioester hydrolase